MADNKAPAYPWYPRDFAGDEPVQLMTLEEEGAYHRLLDHQWLHGSIPADLSKIAKVCKSVPLGKMKKLWPAISPCFVAFEGDGTRLYNRKLERIRRGKREYHNQQSQAGKLGAKARWGEKQDDGDGHGEHDGAEHGAANGGAIAPAIANPSLAFAFASASADKPRSQTRKTPRKSVGADAPKPPGGWPGRWYELFSQHVGEIDVGRIGRRGKSVVRKRGEARATEMWETYCRMRRHYRFGRLDPEYNDLGATTPEDFERTEKFWFDYTEPIEAEV